MLNWLRKRVRDALGMTELSRQVDRLVRLSHGGRATYVGNNRVLTRCVINDGVIGFFVEADDLLLAPLLILTGQYEIPLTNFFLRELKRDSRCVDVGANFGFFTCLMGRFCPDGKVVGIEPDAEVQRLLHDNIFLNYLQQHTSSRHAAAADAFGTLTLHRRVTRSGNTSLHRVDETYLELLREPRGESFEVQCLRIDDLLPEFGNRIDFIKVDVEGAEPLVLRGAAETIAANPQIRIVMEWSPGQIRAAGFDVAAFLKELAAMGLHSADIGPTGIDPLPLSALINVDYRAGILLRRNETVAAVTAGAAPQHRRANWRTS